MTTPAKNDGFSFGILNSKIAARDWLGAVVGLRIINKVQLTNRPAAPNCDISNVQALARPFYRIGIKSSDIKALAKQEGANSIKCKILSEF